MSTYEWLDKVKIAVRDAIEKTLPIEYASSVDIDCECELPSVRTISSPYRRMTTFKIEVTIYED